MFPHAGQNPEQTSLQLTPWWHESADRNICVRVAEQTLPAKADVVVVGSGYTGLHAALVCAEAGRETLVVDAGELGFGCSSRNGGQISSSIKPGFEVLKKRHGESVALAIHQEGHRSLQWLGEFIEQAGLDCDFDRCGRFHAAHNASTFNKLSQRLNSEHPLLASGAQLISQAEQQAYIRSDAYFGGAVFPRHASVHPAKYHRELVRLAAEKGVRFMADCRVESVRGEGPFRLLTSRGEVLADKVVMATNGYTSGITPQLQRRVIPIGSYMIATEQIQPELLNGLLPTGKIISDSRKVVYYYRKSPDGQRILFGGRVSGSETDPAVSGPQLQRELVNLLPELEGIGISHSWSGLVAYTFDELPHIGMQQGLHYAMGYCGAGVGMASYLGNKLGKQLVGDPDGETVFSIPAFPSRPGYRGNPWFLPAAVQYYRLRDRLNI
ncbi:NAD(P)/FAD-dependent oxidoreductase [Aliamphritea hakodatensis]|uniref:NAD(P)/FAD-dependent oxidoreductase n=1 Tax=Aliamphritea hakodatensis TaxID=2895352 RepID=UPI0022FD4F38|nr:FAD-binding oxidoreductase [Aliamphritea hakodatensis]